ncbi:MAG TPA: amidohydrolase family protein [Planctomycetota bacterium]|nr:amidohydrolase family protein [Planctomycetota bacterium]
MRTLHGARPSIAGPALALMLALALVLPSSLVAQAGAPAPAAPRAVAIVDVTVVPMDRERALEHQTVVVRGGRIARVDAASAIPLGDDVERVDGRGKFLMPGLADMHVHTWSADDFPLFLANGVTTVRNMFGAPVHLDWRRRVAEGELLGPTIVTAGPIVDGKPPVWPGSAVVESADQADAVVAEQKEAGYDFVKVYSKLTKPAYDAILAAAKKRGIPVDGHVPDAVGLDAAFASGQRSFEHLMLYGTASASTHAASATSPPFVLDLYAWSRFDPAKAADAAKRTAAAGVWSCPTLIVMERWVSPEAGAKFLEAPEMRYVSPFLRGFWTQLTGKRSSSSNPDLVDAVRRGDAPRQKMTKALRDAGARLILGTDTGNPYVVSGFAVHQELRLLVGAGLTPFEALRAATAAPAEMLGTPAEFGTVAAGARADLVLLDANPLADVANAKAIAGVMARGRWLPRAELQATLDALAERYAAASSAPASAPSGGAK